MDKKINIEQNKVENLDCLASQRYLYSNAKKYMAFYIFLNLIIIVIASFFVFIFNNGYMFNIKYDLSPYFALLSIIITLLNPLIIIPEIKSKKELASKIQELFDTRVLSIEWNSLNIGSTPDIENVRIYSDKYKKYNNYTYLENWYSPKVDDVPLSIGRIVCQRSNLWWNISLRERYIKTIITVSIVLSIIIVLFGLFSNPSFSYIVLNIATPLLPIFMFCIEQYRENKDTINNLNNLKQELNYFWQNIINNQNYTNNDIFSRKIQDEIYKNRKDSQLIFDWFYKIYRNNDEEAMHYSVDNMISEYKNSIS